MMFLLLLFLRFVMDNIDDFAAEAAKRKDGDVVLRVFKERARVKVVCLLLFIARVLHLRRFSERFSIISTYIFLRFRMNYRLFFLR